QVQWIGWLPSSPPKMSRAFIIRPTLRSGVITSVHSQEVLDAEPLTSRPFRVARSRDHGYEIRRCFLRTDRRLENADMGQGPFVPDVCGRRPSDGRADGAS